MKELKKLLAVHKLGSSIKVKNQDLMKEYLNVYFKKANELCLVILV